jgi:hypothetical protein
VPDGIHTSFALGANVFTNNTVRRTCDDALAISAPWLANVTAASGVTVTVSRSFASPFPPGTSVPFINPDTGALAGSATIVSESPAFDQQKFTDGETVTLTLDHAVPGVTSDFGLVDNDPVKKGSGSIIALNTVQDGVFARAVWLAGVQNVSVHDNYIQRTSSNGIFIQQLGANNTDAGPSSAISIKNNLVDSAINYGNVSHGVTFAAASIYSVTQNSANAQVTSSPHSNISVTGNRITNSARTAIRLENVNTGDISGNVIQGFGLAPAVNLFTAPTCCETFAQYQADFAQAVLTPSSTGVSIAGNSSSGSGSLLVNASTASGYPRLGAGSFAAAYGSGLASSTVVASPPFPTTLGGGFVFGIDYLHEERMTRNPNQLQFESVSDDVSFAPEHVPILAGSIERKRAVAQVGAQFLQLPSIRCDRRYDEVTAGFPALGTGSPLGFSRAVSRALADQESQLAVVPVLDANPT